MNLYMIEFKHPGGVHKGILTYFIGKNDKDVYEFLASNKGLDFCTDYADSERDARQYESEEAGDAYRNKIMSNRGTLYQKYSDDGDFSYGSCFTEYGWKLLQENITAAELKTLINLGIEIQPKSVKVKNMTKRSLNAQIKEFNGFGKTDSDFNKMIDGIHELGLHLEAGRVEYSDDMSQKRYSYTVVLVKTDENGDSVDTKLIGYLEAVKYFLNGLDNPYELLAYVS